jgi:hypothetical protein
MKIRKAMFSLVTIVNVFAPGDLLNEGEGTFSRRLSQGGNRASQLPRPAISANSHESNKKRPISVVGYNSDDSCEQKRTKANDSLQVALSENSVEELLELFGMGSGTFYSEREKLINELAQGLFPGVVLHQNPTNS